MQSGHLNAFNAFVKRAVEQLRTDAKGRSDKMRELRDSCTRFLGTRCPCAVTVTSTLCSPLASLLRLRQAPGACKTLYQLLGRRRPPFSPCCSRSYAARDNGLSPCLAMRTACPQQLQCTRGH